MKAIARVSAFKRHNLSTSADPAGLKATERFLAYDEAAKTRLGNASCWPAARIV